jgi:hypothetical protein
MRSLDKRLAAIEARMTTSRAPSRRGHRVIAETDEEAQAGIDALIASGAALPDDFFVVRMMVDPLTTTERKMGERVDCANLG